MSVKSTPEVTVNPKFGRRSWVKLWVNEWLDGTTRFEMSDAQRAFWTDLLALAGRSRFPGIICAGAVGNRLVGYPLNRFQSLMSEPIDIEATFALFERSGKIKVETTQEGTLTLYKVELLNWNKYQSEYQRQKKYRGTGDVPSDSHSYTRGTKKVTRQKENQTEKETERRKQDTAAAFLAIGFKEAFGHCAFQDIWVANYLAATENGSWLTGAMERTIQACQDSKVGVPPQFFSAKHEVEAAENLAFKNGERR